MAHEGSPVIRWLVEAAFFPGWRLSSDPFRAGPISVITDHWGLLLLFAGLAFFAWRLSNRSGPGWPRCLAAGVLAAELTSLVVWVVLVLRTHYTVAHPLLVLRDLLRSGLIFGLAAGALLAVLAVGVPRGRGHGARSARAAKAPRRSSIPIRSSARSSARSVRQSVRQSIRRQEGGVGMATAQGRPPIGSAPGDVTRYLCAAAYVDEAFADQVVEGVVADEASAVAPSPDVDLATVACHCLAAREIRHHRDLRLAAAVGVVALVAPLWLVFVAALLSIAAKASHPAPSLATRGQTQPGGRPLVRAGFAAGVVTLVALTFGISASLLSMPAFWRWLVGAYLFGIPALLASAGAALFAYATVVAHDLEIDELLRTRLTRDAFPHQPLPPVPARDWIRDRLAVIREAQDGNVTIYSGYSPFIGYAQATSNWNLTVPLLPAEDSLGLKSQPATARAFAVTELIDHVRRHIAELTTDPANAADKEALGALFIEDRVFADGTMIVDDDRFMTEAGLSPIARLTPEAVEEIMLNPTGAVRHQLAVHVQLWGGDVVPSVFLHFSVAGETLHLHCDNHVLSPVAAEYHVVDRLPDPLTPERRQGLLATAVWHTRTALFAAPLRAVRHSRFEGRHNRQMVDELIAMEQDPEFDFGARLSVREMALSPTYHNYFQVIDADRIIAMVERHGLAAIRTFLDSRGFDTTDFRSQQQTILNHGLIQQGGMSIVGNQAIGSGASATQNVTEKAGTGKSDSSATVAAGE